MSVGSAVYLLSNLGARNVFDITSLSLKLIKKSANVISLSEKEKYKNEKEFFDKTDILHTVKVIKLYIDNFVYDTKIVYLNISVTMINEVLEEIHGKLTILHNLLEHNKKWFKKYKNPNELFTELEDLLNKLEQRFNLLLKVKL